MKYIYLVIDSNENGKRYAFAKKLSAEINLINVKEIPFAEVVRYCPTWKEAKETAERWNAVHKANGCYYFDEPSF